VLTRFPAFRNQLYARMEEISFRTSMTVLGGVVAVAAVIAAVTVAMSQGSTPVRPTALRPPPASHSSTRAALPPTPAASPSQPSPTASKPSAARPPVVAAAPRAATYPATDGDSRPYRAPNSPYHRAAAERHLSSAMAAWAAWWQGRLAAAGAHGGGRHPGIGGGRGFGGFGGGGMGHR
jgi:hypothetical protein